MRGQWWFFLYFSFKTSIVFFLKSLIIISHVFFLVFLPCDFSRHALLMLVNTTSLINHLKTPIFMLQYLWFFFQSAEEFLFVLTYKIIILIHVSHCPVSDTLWSFFGSLFCSWRPGFLCPAPWTWWAKSSSRTRRIPTKPTAAPRRSSQNKRPTPAATRPVCASPRLPAQVRVRTFSAMSVWPER